MVHRDHFCIGIELICRGNDSVKKKVKLLDVSSSVRDDLLYYTSKRA